MNAGRVSRTVRQPSEASDAIPNVNYCKLQKLPTYVNEWMQMGIDDRLPARALIVNLSSRLRQFHEALKSQMPEAGK